MRALASLLLVRLIAEPATAHACSPMCGDSFAPSGTEEAPAHLPENGVFVDGPFTSAPAEITMVRIRGSERETRSLGMILRAAPISDVAAGDRLVFTTVSTCSGLVTSVIDVTPAAPLPTELGVLEVEASRRASVAVWDNRGSCTSELASTAAPFTLTLDPSLDPWRDALTETVMVDDVAWWGVTDTRVAPRFVFTACEPVLPSQTSVVDLGVGAHQLRIEGRLRGFDHVLSSNDETFHLDCASGSASCAALPPRAAGGGWVLAAAALALAAARARRSR